VFEGLTANPVVAKLQAGIAFTARRHKVIANNIANVATPGFKAKDLSVEAFQDAMQGASVRLEEAMKEIESPDAGTVGENGNNVSIEKEMSKLSGNVMRHNILISMLDKQFRMLEAALRERI